ncbi:MAG: thioredoxin domain-containing protein, partial [Chloroflexi bacterium]|nr:thioredoxin domain-containing protein [Chloroflexota bacterium]
GGWPMSVFLTPDGVPFYGGTYWPPTPRGGMPGFVNVLLGVADAWDNRRDDVLRGGASVLQHIQPIDLPRRAGDGMELSDGILKAGVESAWRQFDWRSAGWGGAPKFPQAMTIEFLLRYHHRSGESLALEMAAKTLTAMARGGLYDQLGGGFHRYATDNVWLVPHFEKMLYDNAQLARVYLHAFQVTSDGDYHRAVEETLKYVMREMTDPAGGFYSSQDADSEGEEGKFFIWQPAEIRALLGDDAALFVDAYGVTERGNFEGRNILSLVSDPATLARKHNLAEDEMEARLAAARARLLAEREKRVHPGADDKVLAGWNGLMLAAFAEAARVLRDELYRQTAERNADFILREMRTSAGRLYRTWRKGRAKLNGYLEDYANFIEGLLALYETTFDARWFIAARELADSAVEHFADPNGGFFDTSDDHETLVTRPKSLQDNAVPSGNAMMATVLLRLAALTGEGRYADLAEGALRPIQPLLAEHPTAFAQGLCALTFALGPTKEIAIVGDPNDAGTQFLLDATFRKYRPLQVVALARRDETSPIPLMAGREMRDGKPTASVCLNFACRLPVTDAGELEKQLDETHF